MTRPTPRDFTEKEMDYYSRQIVLKEVGLEGQRRLRESKVCVVGAGGLGSPILTQLASMGVGTLRVVDRDIVEVSNLQRQHLYGVHVIGVPKVEAAERRLREINPFIDVEPVPLSVTPGNAERIIAEADVVVDALDSMRARYALNRAIQAKFDTMYPAGIIAQTLRLFGQGMKVVVEITAMAADAGAVPVDRDVIAIAGAGRGADTAVVVKPAYSHSLFDMVVREIIAKPRNLE